MICFIGFLVVIILFIFLKICNDRTDWIILPSISLILIITISVLSILGLGTYIIYRFNYNSEVIALQQTRAVYIDELVKYEEMRNRDYSSSLSYLTLKEKIVEFNRNINISNEINNILFDYVFINPAYREIEPIPLSVG